MKNKLINVLLVDDEDIVREGLKHIIEWNAYGFCICAEASNGEDALAKIKKYNPGLVLLDIRMPKIHGTKLIELVRADGFDGDFIILSGYTDFKYAQTALHHGVSFYLTKPIDEDELIEAIIHVRKKIEAKQNTELSLTQYLRKAKSTVLRDLFLGAEFNTSINYAELGLAAPIYQVVVYEEYTPFHNSYNFADLLKVTNHGNDSFEHLALEHFNVILLKGSFALDRFSDCLRHYEQGAEKGSPLDTIFLAYGPTTTDLSTIRSSFALCTQLMGRRFFCDENQHVLSYEVLPKMSFSDSVITPEKALAYSHSLLNYIQSYNRRQISAELSKLRTELYNSGDEIIAIKHFLADIFLQIKHMLLLTYHDVNIPFAHNAAIIELIENKNFLYQILLYFTEQFDMIIRAIGNNSSDSIFDDILYYINHNYPLSLKLESIAPLFGYNSSYLGKLFSQKMKMSFNHYLDLVRIEAATKLLTDTSMKVYEISAKVGYKNVDYFHQKFKKEKGISPAEFRKKL